MISELISSRIITVVNTIQIEKMSRKEKLQAMETLWADLSKTETQVESPSWHNDVLKETEARVAAGLERIADWPAAKRELRSLTLQCSVCKED